MNAIFIKKTYLLQLTLVILFAGFFSNAPAQLNFTDNFSTNTNAAYSSTGIIGASQWSVLSSGADFGARRNVAPTDQLELSNDISATANADGWVLAQTASRHHPVLNQNTTVTWNFNMRQSQADPSGFATGSDGAAFILAGTNTTTATVGTGYAVVLGQAGTTDPVKLVSYSAGLQTQTAIITSNTAGLTDFGTEYLSIRVVYTAATNTWQLLVRNDGATAFVSPVSGIFTSQGTAINNTYTANALGLMGAYYQASILAGQSAFFDNITVNATTNSFVTTWIPGGANTDLTIPTTGTGYNYNVYCQNMTSPDIAVNSLLAQTGNASFTGLTAASTYRVFISGNFPRIYFNNGVERTKIRTIDNWGNIVWTSMAAAFYGCSNLTYNTTSVPNLSGVTDMSYMFAKATNFSGNIGGWNTSTVTNMSYLFFQAANFNGAIGAWNTAAVTNMSYMFAEASDFNRAIATWNTAAVTNMNHMFFKAISFNQPIGTWNTAAVTDMSYMFAQAMFFNRAIGAWNTAAVTNMRNMFTSAIYFNQAIGAWNTAAVTDMSYMFASAHAFNQPIGTWNTAIVTNMSSMFNDASSFNQPIGTWNTTAVTNMSYMFGIATSFNQPIGTWNTANVTDMSFMFAGAYAFNQSIGTWNTAAVTNMFSMFYQATAFNQPIGTWNTAAVTNMNYMFYYATAFNQPIGTWNTAAVTTMYGMFINATAFNQSLGTWNTAAVTSMYNMLDNCGMSINNYDNTIIGWAANPAVQSNITLGALNLKYCSAETERTNLISSKGWTFLGDSKFCSEINVQGNSISIVDGDISPDFADHSDFGTVLLPASFNRIFTIQNTGLAALTISNITLSGADAGEFSISGVPAFPFVITGASTQNLTVTFTPTSEFNVKTAVLTINNDDLDESVYNFNIQGYSGCITVANGNWSNPSTWKNSVVPASNTNIIIANNVDLDNNYNTGIYTLTIQNNQSLNIPNTRNLIIDAGGTIHNNGILISNIGGNLVNNGTLTNNGTLDNWESFTNNTTFDNLGTVNNTRNLNNPIGATLNNSGIFNNNAGGFLTNNGLLDNIGGVYTNNFGATLKGTGTYNGILTNDGTFAPGNSPGVFTINGTFTNNGIIEIEIGGDNGAGDPNGHDRIVVNGNVFLGGEVRVNLINGFLPVSGSEYNFITGTTVSNIFSTTTLPGAGWSIPYTATTANARYDQLLPIELISFDATRQSINHVQLHCVTASELNNQGFDVERMLQYETEFTKVAWVDGKGTTNNTSDYRLIDNNGYEGVSYYRLKQIDFDGSFSYSNIKAVSGWKSDGNSIDVFPNPIQDNIHIRLISESKEISLQLLDSKGALVLSKTIAVPTDKLITLEDLGQLADGLYVLSITTDLGEVITKKVVKKEG